MQQDELFAPANGADYDELFTAAVEGHVGYLRAALKPSLDINVLQAYMSRTSLRRRSALHLAALHGQVEAVQFLLAHGADVDLQDSESETPLHNAAFAANLTIMKLLLDSGADVHHPNLIHKKPRCRKYPLCCLLE